MTKSDIRVYGNQHGTWVEIKGKTREEVDRACEMMGVTIEEFVKRAVTMKATEVLVGSTHL